jgi:hypothetical protein
MARSDPFSLEGMQEIPDPAARLPAQTSPAQALPVAMGDTPKPPAERSLTRAERSLRARAAITLSVAWLSAVVMHLGVRADLATLAAAGPIAAWTLGGAAVLWLVLRPGVRGLPAGVRVVQHAAWIVPAAYALGAALVASPDGPVTWLSVRFCLVSSTVMALGPLTAAALFLRGSFLSAPGWRGAAVGGVAGLAGSIGIHAHCPIHSIGHLLAAHGAAIAVGVAAGAALGRLGGRA